MCSLCRCNLSTLAINGRKICRCCIKACLVEIKKETKE